jgi:hypothetical protein
MAIGVHTRLDYRPKSPNGSKPDSNITLKLMGCPNSTSREQNSNEGDTVGLIGDNLEPHATCLENNFFDKQAQIGPDKRDET